MNKTLTFLSLITVPVLVWWMQEDTKPQTAAPEENITGSKGGEQVTEKLPLDEELRLMYGIDDI